MKTNKLTILILTSILIITFQFKNGNSQTISQNYFEEIKAYQDTMNMEFADIKKSPLVEEDIVHFKKLDFFTIDSNYKFTAKFKLSLGEFPFPMKTTTSRKPKYIKYGEVTFEFKGTIYKLNVYQNLDLIKKEGYLDYLFLPFTDFTNGFETYGGGRYIDLKIPEGDTIVIDFNKCYNPYCAYNHKYSCPIPPEENHLELEVKAGVKKYH